jgi:hypothetical protein
MLLVKRYLGWVAMSPNGPFRPILRRNRMSGVDAVDGSSTRHLSAMNVGAVKAHRIRRS